MAPKEINKDFFRIRGSAGKHSLSGEITVGGAKNAALKIMAGSLLFENEIVIENVPEIEDVERMGELLEGIGVKILKNKNKRKIVLPKKIGTKLLNKPARAMRSSIVLVGPLLSRIGEATFPNPGGCDFGSRPIDLFLEGFEKMGAKIESEGENYVASAPNGLKGAKFFFKVQSHTGTETLMMAAILAKGKTILKNCALEPEIKALADFLNSCGAKIKGAGTSTIIIHGVKKPLAAKEKIYAVMPDRIETGTFMILGALASEKLKIKNCISEHVEIVTEILSSAGVKIETSKNEIVVYGSVNLKAVNVRTHEYPGLPTDLQALMAVFLTQAKGESALFETIYEGRLGYIPYLASMGANIKTEDNHRAIIKGATPLFGRKVTAPDLRSGMAFIIAAIIARGESAIENAYVVERGYENIVERLQNLGVDIKGE